MRLGLGLTLALIGLAPAAGQSLVPPAPPKTNAAAIKAWVDKYIDTTGWALLSDGEESYRYLSKSGVEHVSPTDVRIWVRNEDFEPTYVGGVAFRSSLILTEYDCNDRRYRQLAIDAYPFNNLGGTKRSEDIQSPTWVYPRPNTVGAFEVKAICEALLSPSDPAATGAPVNGWQPVPK